MSAESPQVNLADSENVRAEIVGAGFEDADGRPTRPGVYYLLVDLPASDTYGLIVSGPLLPSLDVCRLPADLRSRLAEILRAAADEDADSGRAVRGARRRALADRLTPSVHPDLRDILLAGNLRLGARRVPDHALPPEDLVPVPGVDIPHEYAEQEFAA